MASHLSPTAAYNSAVTPAALSAWWTRARTLLLSGALVVVFAEVVLRLLPVYGGTHTLPVDEANPVIRFEPDREFVWSRDWNFSIVNRVRVNNFGFVSDNDYEPDAEGPLLAVIGDGYVEALMVPFPSTCAGRLAEKLDGTARVYAFGVSSSPLSQYLAFAEYARDTFGPDGIVITVTENDYDESLRKYGPNAGKHQFVERSEGRLLLVRNDFGVGFLHGLARMSAIARYYVGNLDARGVTGHNARILRLLADADEPLVRDERRQQIRVADSKRAVDAFLDMLPALSDLAAERIVFVVDGVRPDLYRDEWLERMNGSYLDVMRRYFLAGAVDRGYETIDLQAVFAAHYRMHRERFDWPQDGHWNALGHEMCAREAARSKLVAGMMSEGPSSSREGEAR